jgi:hypothetical protein
MDFDLDLGVGRNRKRTTEVVRFFVPEENVGGAAIGVRPVLFPHLVVNADG